MQGTLILGNVAIRREMVRAGSYWVTRGSMRPLRLADFAFLDDGTIVKDRHGSVVYPSILCKEAYDIFKVGELGELVEADDFPPTEAKDDL